MVLAIAANSQPVEVRKLRGEERAWRIRVGPYRVVYDIHDDRALVVGLKVRGGTRRRVGDRLRGKRCAQARREDPLRLGLCLAVSSPYVALSGTRSGSRQDGGTTLRMMPPPQ
ncbi:MAG: type II toxin-antitoxin system RelE/ParE family toxin [Chloroflexi bacterium]|nr:type II toxin-antitoxin system RelE/ParE family toxin [Chloroflexota bacterium]